MSRSSVRRLLLSVLALSLPIASLLGCASSISSYTGSQVTVSVSGPTSVRLNATAQFSVTISGTTDTGVVWLVNGVTGGSSSTGIISTNGLYTAPSRLPSPSSVAITALSSASPAASGTIALAVQNPVPVITSATAIQVGRTLTFSVNIIGVGFVPTSIISVGTSAQTTTYVSTTELQATVTVTIGTTSLALSVTNPNPGGSTSVATSVGISILNPLPVISSATAVQVGSTLNYAVDIVGMGFTSSSIINVGTTSQTTTFVSSTELQSTIVVASGTTSLLLSVTNPNPGGSTSNAVTVVITFLDTTATVAARLLDQATFGPTSADIQHVQQVGINGYLAEQFATPTTALAAIPTNPLPALCINNTAVQCAESEWWQTAITAPDQLRQRVAFALSMMFVVSTQSIPAQAIPAYHNMLANDAFGNFYTIMHDVTVSPAMGDYLNMLDSAAPAAGQIANENYPRENMQLFTMGLNQLNQDGTEQLDGSGNPIPNYTQVQVQAFARAYTGWTFAHADGSTVTKFPNKTADYNDPMVAVDSAHDTTSKILLNGTVLPAGQTSVQDLSGALTNIFNNSNVGPFVCKQLIQHLVTSTPSPAYVSRIAAVFADNGSGVRGDMKAVITAIFTDQEGRAGDTNSSFDGGHLREPILFITAMMRGLAFTNTDANGSYFSLSNQSSKLSEEPYRANAVFNFYPPDYVIPATTLNAPEFGIENTATAVLRLTLADAIVNNKINSFKVDLTATSSLGTLAANPANLVSALNTLFMHSQMPANMQTAIISAITPLTNYAQRTRVAVYLVITSSQYKIIH